MYKFYCSRMMLSTSSIALIFLVACINQDSYTAFLPTRSPTPIPTPGIMAMATIEPRPEFIREISPSEYTVISYDYYHYKIPNAVGPSISLPEGFYSAICVDFFLQPLIQKDDELDTISKVLERIDLFVNDRKVTIIDRAYRLLLAFSENDEWENTTWVESDAYCWEAPLHPGIHEVIFQFQQTSGDVQTYTWYFEINE
jgi:hypothetical protein